MAKSGFFHGFLHIVSIRFCIQGTTLWWRLMPTFFSDDKFISFIFTCPPSFLVTRSCFESLNFCCTKKKKKKYSSTIWHFVANIFNFRTFFEFLHQFSYISIPQIFIHFKNCQVQVIDAKYNIAKQICHPTDIEQTMTIL